MRMMIDVDKLIEFIYRRFDITWENDYEGGIKDACVDILNFIDSAPSIDLVRCAECKYYRADDYSGVFHCFYSSNAVTSDDYCSYGEREGE